MDISTAELSWLAAVVVVGAIAWIVRRGHLSGDPIDYAVGIVQGIEHLWEQGRIDEGDRLDTAIHALTQRYRYLDYESAKLIIEGVVRMMKQVDREQGR